MDRERQREREIYIYIHVYIYIYVLNIPQYIYIYKHFIQISVFNLYTKKRVYIYTYVYIYICKCTQVPKVRVRCQHWNFWPLMCWRWPCQRQTRPTLLTFDADPCALKRFGPEQSYSTCRVQIHTCGQNYMHMHSRTCAHNLCRDINLIRSVLMRIHNAGVRMEKTA